MMSLDTVQYVFMLLTFPIAVFTIVMSVDVRARSSVAIALVLVAWFGVTALTALPPVGPLPGALFGIVLPVVVLSGVMVFSASVNALVLKLNVAALVALHVTRIAGGLFIPLFWEGRLSNPFAYVAGGGDLLAAALAIPAAIIAWRGKAGWAKWVLAWNVLGFADFMSAVGLGITSQPGSPLRLFYDQPGAAILGELPWRFIPGYFVPLYIIIHVALFVRLFHQLATERLLNQRFGVADAVERGE
jgi:hypothetical protein